MSDKLSQKCHELGVDEDAFTLARRELTTAQEAAEEASAAMELALVDLAGTVTEQGIKELRQAAEMLLIDTIMGALTEC